MDNKMFFLIKKEVECVQVEMKWIKGKNLEQVQDIIYKLLLNEGQCVKIKRKHF